MNPHNKVNGEANAEHFEQLQQWPPTSPPPKRARTGGRWAGRARALATALLVLMVLVPLGWWWVGLVDAAVPSSRTELADDLAGLQHTIDTRVFEPLLQDLRH